MSLPEGRLHVHPGLRPQMISQKYGKVISISSVRGFGSSGREVAYAAPRQVSSSLPGTGRASLVRTTLTLTPLLPERS